MQLEVLLFISMVKERVKRYNNTLSIFDTFNDVIQRSRLIAIL